MFEQVKETCQSNTLLQWELNWIDQNADRYKNDQHIQNVKSNIIKRYTIQNINRKISLLEEEIKKLQESATVLNCVE